MPLNRWVTRGLRSDRRASPKLAASAPVWPRPTTTPERSRSSAAAAAPGSSGASVTIRTVGRPVPSAPAASQAAELVGPGQAQVGGVVRAPVPRVQKGPLDVASDDR